MRAYSWVALGAVAFACGGSAFTSNGQAGGSGNTAGTDGSGAAAGAPDGSGATSSGGSTTGSAGEPGVGGSVSVGGSGLGGDLVAGGAPPGGGTAGSGGTTSTAGSGGTRPVDTECPKVLPIKGGACSDGLLCTFGTDVRTACRNSAKCENGAWVITKPSCENLSACENIQVNAACDPSSKPCLLSEPEGIYCVCTGCGSGGPCNTDTVWACAAGSGGSLCPKLAPNYGASCVGERECGYGSCATGNNINAVCDGTSWALHNTPCPL